MIEGQEDRIQLHGEGEWAFGVLPDFERDLAGQPVGTGRLFFACDQRLLITGRLHTLRAIDDVRRAAERGQAIDQPALAIAAQVESFVELMEQRLDAMTEQLDTMEDLVLGERTDLGGHQLGPVRRELARHRRELQALRAALTRGRSGREALRAHPVSEQLNAILAQVEDVDHEFVGLQERARLLHEEIDTLLNDATNKSMRTLTVISTLLIPPTLVVGAFGMNLPGMPFEHSRSGFMAASVICIALVIGTLYMLRRMGMLS
jgi:zinc transporter